MDALMVGQSAKFEIVDPDHPDYVLTRGTVLVAIGRCNANNGRCSCTLIWFDDNLAIPAGQLKPLNEAADVLYGEAMR
jgi:hypothetical protein